jgi:hypothetical protein
LSGLIGANSTKNIAAGELSVGANQKNRDGRIHNVAAGTPRYEGKLTLITAGAIIP